MAAHALDSRTWYVDVRFLGAERLIATAVLETDEGLLLVDPGPTSSLAGLRRGLAERGRTLADVRAVLLTHIHLDHAGATGTIAAAHPDVQVYVHGRGAPHLVRPERLLASARRIYGDRMDALWGDFEAVPEANVHRLAGGETIAVEGRRLEVAYTPGHAIHHVSYLDRGTGTAFVGDVAGMRLTGLDYVAPVTPPPDVDLDAWGASLDRLRAWRPDRLFLTHFGPSNEPSRHLSAYGHRLHAWAEDVRRSLGEEGDDEARAARFGERKAREMQAALPEDAFPAYQRFADPAESWYGLARYWRKHAPSGAAK